MLVITGSYVVDVVFVLACFHSEAADFPLRNFLKYEQQYML